MCDKIANGEALSSPGSRQNTRRSARYAIHALLDYIVATASAGDNPVQIGVAARMMLTRVEAQKAVNEFLIACQAHDVEPPEAA